MDEIRVPEVTRRTRRPFRCCAVCSIVSATSAVILLGLAIFLGVDYSGVNSVIEKQIDEVLCF